MARGLLLGLRVVGCLVVLGVDQSAASSHQAHAAEQAVVADVAGCEDGVEGLSLRQLRRHAQDSDRPATVPLLSFAQQGLKVGGGREIPPPSRSMHCWQYSPPSKSKAALTILTAYGNVPADYGSCLRETRKSYAKTHGLEYCEYNTSISSTESFSWQKWIAVKSLLHAEAADGGPREAVWWVDADALIKNQSISIMEVANLYPSKDAIFTADCEGLCQEENYNKTNCGVFIVRNTAWMDVFMESVHTEGAAQGVLSDRLMIEEYWAKKPEEFSKHVEIVSMKVMSSNIWQYRHGDFVFHPGGNSATAAGTEVLDKWSALVPSCQRTLLASGQVSQA
mmetsp:Transcript_45706/g.74255  ORF Transcript_45706/g.74255 Transcript_45706/m.74255 type:complete len:337 (-) Transcript_45706:78-1088(-)